MRMYLQYEYLELSVVKMAVKCLSTKTASKFFTCPELKLPIQKTGARIGLASRAAINVNL